MPPAGAQLLLEAPPAEATRAQAQVVGRWPCCHRTSRIIQRETCMEDAASASAHPPAPSSPPTSWNSGGVRPCFPAAPFRKGEVSAACTAPRHLWAAALSARLWGEQEGHTSRLVAEMAGWLEVPSPARAAQLVLKKGRSCGALPSDSRVPFHTATPPLVQLRGEGGTADRRGTGLGTGGWLKFVNFPKSISLRIFQLLRAKSTALQISECPVSRLGQSCAARVGLGRLSRAQPPPTARRGCERRPSCQLLALGLRSC